MGGNEIYGAYSRDYGTGRTANITNSCTYDDEWGINKKVAYIYDVINSSTVDSLWKEYATSTAIISENLYTKCDVGTTYTTVPPIDYEKGIYWDTGGWVAPVVAPGERLRQMIRDRMAPVILHNRKRTPMSMATDVREERARQTLRRIIGGQAYKKFMRDGFITVVPKSGLTYRIYPGYGITEVYDKGIMVDRLCVVLQGDFPPTDSILMRYLLILNDEGEFSKYAIKHHVSSNSGILVFPTQEEVKPLTEAWAELKLKVA